MLKGRDRGSCGVFERVGAGMWVEVVTDTFMQNGAGATCRYRLEGFPVAAVLYYQAMSLMCFPFLPLLRFQTSPDCFFLLWSFSLFLLHGPN